MAGTVDDSFDPAALHRALAALQSRIERLERSPRAPHTSVRGGSFTVLDETTGDPILTLDSTGLTMWDDTGQRRVTLGVLSNGAHGILVEKPDGTDMLAAYHEAVNLKGGNALGMDADGALSTPNLAIPMAGSDDYVEITSGSFTRVWFGYPELISHRGLKCYVPVFTFGGGACDIRLSANSGSNVSGHHSCPDGTNADFRFQWLHGLTLGSGPQRIEVQARKTSGGGTCRIYRPYGMWQTGPSGCTSLGV